MASHKRRTHLPRSAPTRRKGKVVAIGQAACGLDDPKKWSFNPRRVTCGGCLRSPLMTQK